MQSPLQEENVEQSLIKGDDVAQPFPGVDVILTFHQDVNFTWSINERNVYMSEGVSGQIMYHDENNCYCGIHDKVRFILSSDCIRVRIEVWNARMGYS